MSLQMMTDEQFDALKCQAVGKGKRQFAKADLVSAFATPGDRLTDISLWVGGEKGVRYVTAMLSLLTENLLPSQVRKLIGQPVEVIYDVIECKGQNPPSVYGKLVAMKCGDTIIHDFFAYR